MAYEKFKDFSRRIASDKVLRDKVFYNAKNSNYDGYQKRLASMAYKSFDKESSGANIVGGTIMEKQQLAEELQKQIIKKFEKRKVH